MPDGVSQHARTHLPAYRLASAKVRSCRLAQTLRGVSSSSYRRRFSFYAALLRPFFLRRTEAYTHSRRIEPQGAMSLALGIITP